MNEILTLYDDTMFWLFPVATSLLSMVAFINFAIPLTYVTAKNLKFARSNLIQNRPQKKQKILWPSVRRWLLNNFLMILVSVMAWPLLRLSGVHNGEIPPWYLILAHLVFFIYLDDFLYYWMHRYMHQNKWLYKKIHKVHHRIITPWAITGHNMHWVEYVLTGSLALLGPTLVGAHVLTLWIWVLIRQWEAAEGHSGLEFRYTPTHLLPGNDGAVHHDMHHAKIIGNYSGFLRWVDCVFGTYSKGYKEDLVKRGKWF